MSQFILDLFFASVFALILLLLTKIRDRTFLGNLESYHYSYAGVAVLCFVSLLQMAGHQGLLLGVPFLAEEIYRNLIEATGIVAGVTLLLAGVSFWLPYKRSTGGRMAVETAVRAEIIRGLEQSHEVNLLFLRFLEIICRNFNFQGFALFRYHSRKERFLCTNRSGISQEIEPALGDYTFTYEKSESALKEIPERFNFEFILPIYVSDKLGALACFRSDGHRELSEKDMSILHDAGRLLSWRLTSEFFVHKGTYWVMLQEFRNGLMEILSADTSVKKNLPELYHICQKYLGTEYLALAWTEGPGRDFRRYSVGINGNVLQNDSPAPMPEGSLGAKIISGGKAAAINDLSHTDDFVPEPLVSSCGQRSLLGIPIIIDGHIGAILTLGSPRPWHFNARRRFMAGLLSEMLTGSIIAEQSRHRVALLAKCLESLKRIYLYLDEVPAPEDIYAKIAEEILATVRTTSVRIFFLHGDGTRLDSVAFKTIRAIDENDYPDHVIIDSRNFGRLEALMEGRTVAYDSLDERNSSDKTAGQPFLVPGIKSQLIIPILSRGLLLGAIVLGEMRQSGRYRYDATIQDYCHGMARALAQGVKQYFSARAVMGLAPSLPEIPEYPDIPPITHRLRTEPTWPARTAKAAPESGSSALFLSERFAGDFLKVNGIPVSGEDF